MKQLILAGWKLKLGLDDWWKAVHVLVADQEFMPHFYRAFFASLVANEGRQKMPLVLMLAFGHGLKSVAVSMLTFYSGIFDSLFKAQGISVGSPKYGRLRKGREIRETIRWVVNALETLRITFAHRYLKERGMTPCIETSTGRNKATDAVSSIHWHLCPGSTGMYWKIQVDCDLNWSPAALARCSRSCN